MGNTRERAHRNKRRLGERPSSAAGCGFARIAACGAYRRKTSRKSSGSPPLNVFTVGSFEDLYRQHVQAVFRFAYHLTGERETAEDVTSEAFLALYRNQGSIDESLLPGWLLTVARNRARDLWRRRRVEKRFADQLDAPTAAPPGGMEAWLLECADLKPVHRTCVMLRYVYGMTRTEIANRTGLSETQVKGHLQYGLKLLRQAYGKSSQK